MKTMTEVRAEQGFPAIPSFMAHAAHEDADDWADNVAQFFEGVIGAAAAAVYSVARRARQKVQDTAHGAAVVMAFLSADDDSAEHLVMQHGSMIGVVVEYNGRELLFCRVNALGNYCLQRGYWVKPKDLQPITQ